MCEMQVGDVLDRKTAERVVLESVVEILPAFKGRHEVWWIWTLVPLCANVCKHILVSKNNANRARSARGGGAEVRSLLAPAGHLPTDSVSRKKVSK
jgi:hypothetical protein